MTITKLIAAMGLGFAFVSSAQATTVQYIMDQSNVLADNVPHLSVTISDVADSEDGGIAFSVQTLPTPVFSGSFSDFGIKTFGFNGDLLSTENVEFTNTASGNWNFGNTGNLSEFGIFQNIADADRGNQTADPLTFTIHKIGDSVEDYATANALGNLFSAHVIGFNTGVNDNRGRLQTSAWFGGNADGLSPPSEVPVPAAAWLLGSGLLGMVGVSRRRNPQLKEVGDV
jgi:hypothetical protein